MDLDITIASRTVTPLIDLQDKSPEMNPSPFTDKDEPVHKRPCSDVTDPTSSDPRTVRLLPMVTSLVTDNQSPTFKRPLASRLWSTDKSSLQEARTACMRETETLPQLTTSAVTLRLLPTYIAAATENAFLT